jgi:pantothenate synthetase
MNSDFDYRQIKNEVVRHIHSVEGITLEYFEIMDLSKFLNTIEKRAFIACKVGNIRLIDNIRI